MMPPSADMPPFLPITLRCRCCRFDAAAAAALQRFALIFRFSLMLMPAIYFDADYFSSLSSPIFFAFSLSSSLPLDIFSLMATLPMLPRMPLPAADAAWLAIFAVTLYYFSMMIFSPTAAGTRRRGFHAAAAAFFAFRRCLIFAAAFDVMIAMPLRLQRGYVD